MKKSENNKKIVSKWFKELRNNICRELEFIENSRFKNKLKFKRKKWTRDKNGKESLGGGEMSVLRGKIFEKAGVNISTVFGNFSDNFKGKIPGTENSNEFWASGISVVIHPFSPKIPAIHMNTRYVVTEKSWFGGGIDITPTQKTSKDSKMLAKILHDQLRTVCDKYDKKAYNKYKKWCDEYFFLPHRNESRGLGGIFYDYVNSGKWDKDFDFNKNVGKCFINSYKKIVKKSISISWNEKDKTEQNIRRARYAEFNLLHDRGTKFGLQTGGNIEAIFMSLPPLATW